MPLGRFRKTLWIYWEIPYLSIYLSLSLSLYIYIYIKWMCVCVCVCMFEHNPGTPGAISTKLGTHIAICMYKNLVYILCIYLSPKHQSPRGGWCGRPLWDSPPRVTNHCSGNVYASRYRSNSSIVCCARTYMQTCVHLYLGTWTAHFNCGVTWR
jgi:hypothetical protein